MTEKSVIIDWKRQNSFFYKLNSDFKLVDMNGSTQNFKLVITNVSGSSIGDYVGDNGCLSDVTNIKFSSMKLNYSPDSYGNGAVSIVDDTSITFGETESYMLSAVFICSMNYYVIDYCLFNTSIPISNKFTLKDGEVLFEFTNEVNPL